MVMVAFVGGIGGQELLLVLAAALVIFGPKRLPELARGIGKITAQVRSANRQIQREIYSNIDVDDLGAELKRDYTQPAADAPRVTPTPAGKQVERGDASSAEDEERPDPGSKPS